MSLGLTMSDSSSEPDAKTCKNFLKYLDDHFKCCDIAKSPHASEEVLRQMAITEFNGYTYLVRAAIIENPNVPKDLVIWLMSQESEEKQTIISASIFWATHFGLPAEWRYDKKEPSFPFELVSTVQEDFDLIASNFHKSMSGTAEHLWHDLASRGIIELSYYTDGSLDFDVLGVSVGPDRPQISTLMGEGYATTWIKTEAYLDPQEYISSFEDFGEEMYLYDDMIYYIQEGEFFPTNLVLGGACIGERDGHLEIDYTNPKLQEYIDKELNDGNVDRHQRGLDYRVEISGKPAWTGPSWTQLSPSGRACYVENLVQLLDHPFYGEWGLAEHILALVSKHPDSEKGLKERIQSLGLESVDAED